MSPEKAKSNSHLLLRERGIPINEHLPVIEAPESLHPQDAKAVARRSVILSYVIGIAYGADVSRLNSFLTDSGLIEYASATEKELLGRAHHTEQEMINAGWLAESVQSLAWCMRLVDLDPFRRCDDDLASHFPRPFADPSAFIDAVRLRPFEEIYQQADLYYRFHWAARNARMLGEKSALSEELIMERRKPLDWVIGVEGDWDEVPLDT
jgi:hypothetical protein